MDALDTGVFQHRAGAPHGSELVDRRALRVVSEDVTEVRGHLVGSGRKVRHRRRLCGRSRLVVESNSEQHVVHVRCFVRSGYKLHRRSVARGIAASRSTLTAFYLVPPKADA
ncbi:hypothetical protein BN903_193 [Halorubrum sp. AJ67]|nr:hypothetical protein BN903_193 [Halorubrum sp. AJ67]